MRIQNALKVGWNWARRRRGPQIQIEKKSRCAWRIYERPPICISFPIRTFSFFEAAHFIARAPTAHAIRLFLMFLWVSLPRHLLKVQNSTGNGLRALVVKRLSINHLISHVCDTESGHACARWGAKHVAIFHIFSARLLAEYPQTFQHRASKVFALTFSP